MNKKDLKIVFFGTPEFAKIILERLIRTGYKPILVVTSPDKPSGRSQKLTPSPVTVLAQQHEIPIATNLTGSDPVKRIDLIIVSAYGKIIPKKVLDIPKYGALNVHPSLLPRWRGPSPIQYAILAGDEETGVTIMLMDEKIDHGPLIANFQFSIFPPSGDLCPFGTSPVGRPVDNFQLTAEELSKKLAEDGAELLIKTIPQWVAGEIKPIPQNHEDATYTKILAKEDGHIDWSKSAEEIERQIRAFTPWPGSFTFWKNLRIEITRGYPLLLAHACALAKGQTFLYSEKQIGVQSGKGVFIIEILRPEGKNETPIKEFLNGHKEIIGAILS